MRYAPPYRAYSDYAGSVDVAFSGIRERRASRLQKKRLPFASCRRCAVDRGELPVSSPCLSLGGRCIVSPRFSLFIRRRISLYIRMRWGDASISDPFNSRSSVSLRYRVAASKFAVRRVVRRLNNAGRAGSRAEIVRRPGKVSDSILDAPPLADSRCRRD